MSVYSAVALFHDVWIVGYLQMDHQVAVVLQINAFGGRIRG